MTIFKCVGFYLLFAFGLCSNAYTQSQTLVGININGEVYPNAFRPSAGFIFEKQFKKHNGFETGLFYRTERIGNFIINNASGSYTSSSLAVSQRYLNVPVLYKYYSSIINFSAGPALDFYVGWKQKKGESTNRITAYDVDPEVKLGFLIKASKVIPLRKQLILEPELRYGSVQHVGIGIAGKYRL